MIDTPTNMIGNQQLDSKGNQRCTPRKNHQGNQKAMVLVMVMGMEMETVMEMAPHG